MRGVQIGKFLLANTIVMPLLLVGSDILSDGGVLGQMWPYTMISKLLVGASGNQAQINSTGQWQTGLGTGEEIWMLSYLFLVSILILIVSIVNLFRSNWLASLLRNARTTVMMSSRELERKDVPVPLGNSLYVVQGNLKMV